MSTGGDKSNLTLSGRVQAAPRNFLIMRIFSFQRGCQNVDLPVVGYEDLTTVVDKNRVNKLWEVFMKAITLKIFAGLVVSFMATMSSASDFLAISDFSQIKWQMRSDGKVYFRNINEFDSSYLGCCYNYHIDPATEPGKAMFSAFLALHMAAKPGNIGVPDKSQASALNYIGRW